MVTMNESGGLWLWPGMEGDRLSRRKLPRGKLIRVRRIFLVAAAVLGCSGGTSSRPARGVPWIPDAPTDLGAVVARVGEVPIFAGEVAAQASRTGQPPRQALDQLIAFALLAEKARAAGVQPAAAPPRELLVQRL